MTIFVGTLAFTITEQDLRELCAPYGVVDRINLITDRDVLPGMNAGASTYAGPSPVEGSGTAWVLLGSWALSPARPTPIHPRRERRGFSALLVRPVARAGLALSTWRTTRRPRQPLPGCRGKTLPAVP